MSAHTHANDASDSYKAIALQTACRAVNTAARPRQAMLQAVDRIGRQIRASIDWTGADTRLIVLPEYVLSGFPMGESIEEWCEKACMAMDGPEYEALGRVAQDNRIFLAGNGYEVDPHFPGLYFQTSFILGPSGDVILRYRRLNSMYAPTPHDIWDRYLDVYGLDGVFPVTRTEIGALAAVASEEILYPEVARCMAMRGAEILVHSTCEISSPRPTPKGIAKAARAIENLAYVVSANTAGMEEIAIPGGSSDGGSQIVDYRGLVLAEAGPGESIVANAEIDLGAQRRYRRRPGMDNLLARQRFELYARSYAEHSFYPANTLAETKATREHFRRTQEEVIARLADTGIL